jgi:hypothetical protein
MPSNWFVAVEVVSGKFGATRGTRRRRDCRRYLDMAAAFVGEFGSEFGLGGLFACDRKGASQHRDIVDSKAYQVDA